MGFIGLAALLRTKRSFIGYSLISLRDSFSVVGVRAARNFLRLRLGNHPTSEQHDGNQDRPLHGRWNSTGTGARTIVVEGRAVGKSGWRNENGGPLGPPLCCAYREEITGHHVPHA